ncbi:MAG TPA: WD40 repeat domain-containing protein, partial [Gemmataceae bacterium]|nr:WD40 repeat domain-containing protein [Gemmataceae bacterium]
TVLTGSFDKTVRLWDVTTGQEVRRFDGHTDAVLSVALSADGRRALSGSLDKTVRLWDVQTGQELRRLDQQSGIRSGVTCVAFSADGKRFLATRGFAEVKHSFKGEPRMEHMEWHRPKDFLDCSITVWETDSGRQLALLLGHADEVTSAAFLPDGERVVSGSFDKTARLWDVKGQTEIRRFQGHTGEIFGIAISPDGRRLLSASGSLGPIPGKEGDKEKEKEKEPQPNPPPPAPKDYTLRLWDVETGKELRRLEGHANAVLGVAFSPDGLKAVSTSFDGTARVWDVEAGVELQRYHGHGSAIPAAVFTPDGGQVLSGGWDNNLRLWRVR